MSRTSWILLMLAGAGLVAVVPRVAEYLLPPIGNELDPAHHTYPRLAGQSSNEIEMAGTISPRFGLRLTAHYETNGARGCKSIPSFLAGYLEGASFPSEVSVPLRVERRGTAFTARLTVDRYIPGPCDWRLGYVKAVISKGSLVSLPNYIIVARSDFNWPPKDTPFENSSDSPVTLRCSFEQLKGLPANASMNACVIPGVRISDKYRHYLVRPTKRIVVHIMDYD
ncbi:hypothetical protein [Pseudoduganella albidiflava]|uniref:Uncharacterized protein n=1 Tax=Pseudoduganella albidiflava TaxID=321983 RepID=A0A411X5W0_9BURK|nr:hypothetical protein [Pseudoduganella albidiflava]QBI04387.1 hypothetical protein EYF70_28905 [Pseudoduganella albidiflava]GGY26856.1 hypothetical protein GCM10007387_06120 [Pseudoduganella albidiflava]